MMKDMEKELSMLTEYGEIQGGGEKNEKSHAPKEQEKIGKLH